MNEVPFLTNRQLYGTDDVPPISKEVCDARIALLDKRLKELDIGSDTYLIKKISDAKEFWKMMSDTQEKSQ